MKSPTIPPIRVTREPPPGESHPAAGPVGISENAGGNDLSEGLEHAVELLFVHGHWQVGNVQVGGVLLLLLYSRGNVFSYLSQIKE